jgi:hypothetical protein
MNKELVPLKAHNLGNLSSFDINLNISEEKRITAWEVYKTLFPNQRRFKEWVEDNILSRENFENGKQYFLKEEYVLIVRLGLQYRQNTEILKKIELPLDSAKFLAAKSNSKLGDALVWKLIEVDNQFKEYLRAGKIRGDGKSLRRDLTDVLQEEQARLKALGKDNQAQWIFKNTTDKIYKMVFGKQAKQLKEEFGTENLRDAFESICPEKLEIVGKLESKLSNLIELEVPEEQREVLLLNYAEKMKIKQLKSA